MKIEKKTTLQLFLSDCVRWGFTDPVAHVAALLAAGEITIKSVSYQGVTRTMVEKRAVKFLDANPGTMLSSTALCLNQAYAGIVKNEWPKNLEYLKDSLSHSATFYQQWHRLQGRWYPMGGMSHIGHQGWRSAFQFAEEYSCTPQEWKDAGLPLLGVEAVMELPRNKKWWGQLAAALALRDVCITGKTRYICFADGRTDGLAHLSVWANDSNGIRDTMLTGISPAIQLAGYLNVDQATAKSLITPMIYGAGAKALVRVVTGDEEIEPSEEAVSMGVGAHQWFHSTYPAVSKLQGKFVSLCIAFNNKGAELTSIVNGEVVTPRTCKIDPDAVKGAIKLWCNGTNVRGCWYPPVMVQTAAAYLPLLVHTWEGCVVKHISESMGELPYLPVHDGHGCRVTDLAAMQGRWSAAMQQLLQEETPYQQIGGCGPQFSRWEEVRHLKV